MSNKPKLTEEEQQLAVSAQEAHNLIEMCNSNGWKFIRKEYFDFRLKEYKDYLQDPANTDIADIQGKRFVMEFVQTLLDEIDVQIKVGLVDEEDLEEIKEKKGK